RTLAVGQPANRCQQHLVSGLRRAVVRRPISPTGQQLLQKPPPLGPATSVAGRVGDDAPQPGLDVATSGIEARKRSDCPLQRGLRQVLGIVRVLRDHRSKPIDPGGVSGAQDLSCQLEGAPRVREGLAHTNTTSGATLIQRPGAGHFPWLDDPAWFNQRTSKLAIMPMSSCSRLWQWKTYFPRKPSN